MPKGRPFVHHLLTSVAVAAPAVFFFQFTACSTSPGADRAGEQASSRTSATLALERLASRQRIEASQGNRPPAVPLAPPEGLDAAIFAPIDRDSLAAIPLATLLEYQAFAPPAPAATPPDPSVDPLPAPNQADTLAAEAALRLYVNGRLSLYANNATEAVNHFRSAARLDPRAPRVWEGLAESQRRAGMIRAAADSTARAVELGSTDPVTLLAAARHSLDRGEPAASAAMVLRLIRSLTPASDPALPLVSRAVLGQSLDRLGYTRAAADALRLALDLPEQFGTPTLHREEVADLYRRRSELWRTIGDSEFRLGRLEASLEAYSHAASFPSLDPAGTLARRVYVAVAAGRPAEAALALLYSFEGQIERAEERSIPLARFIGAHSPESGRLLRRAIAEDLRPAGTLRDSTAGRVARLAAAAESGDRAQATAILRARIAESPGDSLSTRELFQLLDDDSNRASAEELLRLISIAPLDSDTIADACLRAGGVSASELLRAAPLSRGSRPVRIARALLAERAGLWDEAGSAAALLLQSDAGDAGASLAAALTFARLGRWVEAEQALAQFDAAPVKAELTSVRSVARVRALATMQRFEEAYAIARQLVAHHDDPPGRTIVRLLLTAELAVLTGDAAEAERLWRACIELDPYNESPYLPLLLLYAQPEPRGDPQRLNQTARLLREVAPSSRTARFLRARELVNTGRFSAAETDLLALAEEDPTDRAVFELLIAGWQHGPYPSQDHQDVALTRAIAAMSSLAARTTANPVLPMISLSRLESLAGRPEIGLRLLDEQLARTDLDAAEVQAMFDVRTLIMRTAGNADDADALAQQRLESLPPNPTNLSRLAVLSLSRGVLSTATNTLNTRLPPGVTLAPNQAAQLFAAAEDYFESTYGDPAATTQPGADDLLALLDALELRARHLTPALHNIRLDILAAAPTPDITALLRAARAAAPPGSPPQGENDPYLRVLVRLSGRTLNDAALRFVRLAASTSQPPDPRLFAQWFRWSVLAGGVNDAVEAVEAIVARSLETQVLETVLGRAIPSDGTARDAGSSRSAAAELAYTMAIFLASQDREDDANNLYDLALRYNPGHAMAANNLGYTLLEADTDLPRAERLLETAYAARPNDPNVVDSLGWLRYKLGVYTDERDPDGSIRRAGAVTLLRRAVELADNPSPVHLDHLGDAYWAAGLTEEAKRSWAEARDRANQIIGLIQSNRISAGTAELDRLRLLVRATQAKQVTAMRGLPPPIAPISKSATRSAEPPGSP